MLASANIQINGPHPWDIQIHNENFYENVITKGSLGLGESYMAGWWDCERLDEFFYRILFKKLDMTVVPLIDSLKILKARLINMGKRSQAFEIGKRHYDIGNRLYRRMLDKSMIYSCGYWKNAVDLDQAQEHKLDLICRKLNLKPGMKLLDIGCGWGGYRLLCRKKIWCDGSRHNSFRTTGDIGQGDVPGVTGGDSPEGLPKPGGNL